MLDHLRNGQAPIDVAIQHGLDEINTGLAHDPRDAEFVIHDLIDAIERVFLVHQRIEQDPQSPDVLLFATVGFPLQDFGRRVV